MAAIFVDLDRLLKLRLVVARIGEMDLAKWWNTRGQLGPLGAATVRRGLPRTHYFAQARAVFAVAASRCRELFDRPDCVTLWQLPVAIEDKFEARWEHWLDHADEWRPFFLELERLKEAGLQEALGSFGLLPSDASEQFARMRRSAEGRAVALPVEFDGTNQHLDLLALAFARGEPSALAVPFARLTSS